jgi:hypothetical protein
MKYDDVVSHFGTPSDAARALGVDRRLVDGWKKRRIPTKHQLKARQLSDGVLVPDEEAVREAAELAALVQQAAA